MAARARAHASAAARSRSQGPGTALSATARRRAPACSPPLERVQRQSQSKLTPELTLLRLYPASHPSQRTTAAPACAVPQSKT